jgi:hypothetical protein
MSTHRSSLITCILLALIPSLSASAASPSAADLQKSFDDGQYVSVIRSITQILSARQDSGYDDRQLWLLKADALLRTKAPTEAARAFRQAAKVSPTEKESIEADAAAVLADRSPSGAFIPNANDPGPLPAPMEILTADGRRAAENELLDELLAKERSDLSAAARGSNLLPTLEVIPVIEDLRKLAIAASGSDARVRAVAQVVYDHARDLIDNAVRQMGQSVEGIAAVANEEHVVDTYDDDGNFTGEYTYKTGLSYAAAGQLRTILDTASRASSTARDLEAALNGLQEQGPLTASASAAAQLATRANEVLNDTYN